MPSEGAVANEQEQPVQRQHSEEAEHLIDENAARADKQAEVRRRSGQLREALASWVPCIRPRDERPPSLPRGWPNNMSAEDLHERPNRVININARQDFQFDDNFVKTSVYEWYTFLPLFLTFEFNPMNKIANVYFLIIAAAQTIPAITNTFGVPVMLAPLLVIVLIDMVFAILEDVTRHKADAKANGDLTRKLEATPARTGAPAVSWKRVQWWQLSVGDIVQVKNREDIPADLLILGVHEPSKEVSAGTAYVETKSLDGETNLKPRYQLRSLVGCVSGAADVQQLKGVLTTEHPNKTIHRFVGTARLTGGLEKAQAKAAVAAGTGNGVQSNSSGSSDGTLVESLTPDNILLRGTVLRNTKWIIGLVVNTGHDTKVMMAMTKPREKSSQLNNRINAEIKWIALMLAVLCTIGAVGAAVWTAVNTSASSRLGGAWYLYTVYNTGDVIAEGFLQLAYYFLLLYGFIPISLYVTQNFVRFFQSVFMNMDLDMYDPVTDTPARVRTMNLNEELGQISHIFSDKTGTLTENVMVFRKCTIAGRSYGRGTTEISEAALKVAGHEPTAEDAEAVEKGAEFAAPHVNFYDPQLFTDLQSNSSSSGSSSAAGGNDTMQSPCAARYRKDPGNDLSTAERSELCRDFFRSLALCHTVIPEVVGPEGRRRSSMRSSILDDKATAAAAANAAGAAAGGDAEPSNKDSSAAGQEQIVLSASSPDEEALVLGAKYFGFEFLNRQEGVTRLKVTDMAGPLQPRESTGAVREEKYEQLRELPFNSNRKRMSVIVRCLSGPKEGSIRIITKGADSTTLPRLSKDATDPAVLKKTEHDMQQYATAGLRTLVVAAADLTQEAFEQWDKQYAEALGDVAEQAKRANDEPNKIDDLMDQLEQDLTLLGATAIEDKLQEGVGDTIGKMVRGGITVWVITGDKEETAVNIGIACQLIWAPARMERIVINTRTCPTREAVRDKLLLEFDRYNKEMLAADQSNGRLKPKPRALVIDGPAFLLCEAAPQLKKRKKRRAKGAADATNALSTAGASATAGDAATAGAGSSNSSHKQNNSRDALIPNAGASAGNGISHASVSSSSSNGAVDSDAATGTTAAATETSSSSSLDIETGRGSPDIAANAAAGGESDSDDDGNEETDEVADIAGSTADKAAAAAGAAVSEEEVDAKGALVQLATVCQAVVACRMSPDQKKQLVVLVKNWLGDAEEGARTLAVGDGANDVPMIQAAHVGIGISGQEGLQAVNASDYSLAQFRFLQKLLLCHGRYNYWRMSTVTTYLFYKSVVWGIPLFAYAWYNGLSGAFFYDFVNSNLWALIYTALPIILFGVYDMDVLPATCLKYPWLYRTGLNDNFMSPSHFWGWMAQGVLEGVWCTLVVVYALSGDRYESGASPSVLQLGNAAFAITTLVVNAKMLFIQRRWHWVEALVLFASTTVMWGFGVGINRVQFFLTFDWDFYGTQDRQLASPNYWLVLLLGAMAVFMRDLAWRGYHRWWQPKLHHILQQMEANGQTELHDTELPPALRTDYQLEFVVADDANERMSMSRARSMSMTGSRANSPHSRHSYSASSSRPHSLNLGVYSPALRSPSYRSSGHHHSHSSSYGGYNPPVPVLGVPPRRVTMATTDASPRLNQQQQQQQQQQHGSVDGGSPSSTALRQIFSHHQQQQQQVRNAAAASSKTDASKQA